VAGVVTNGDLIHFRVTRTAGNVWKLYYQLVSAAGVASAWVYGGTATNDDIITSEGMLLVYDENDVLVIGNQRSDRAIFKWRGVVNPL
jgi:hypothetical protein